ncbi:MAG TPA: DNA double-strand break repair nuclease NurA [Candidatus Nanoarchaeia archaeon]|nr:DNA double-strand break repair nuclease NurA [Candidatus Nanoarchaeia archaeon]
MKVFDKVISLLSGKLTSSGSAILVGSHERIPIRNEGFIPIAPNISSAQIVFVDGGNGELLNGPNVSVQFVRLYASWYHLNARVKRELRERFVVVFAQQKGLDLSFEAKVFDLDGNELSSVSFDAFDPAIALSGRRADPSSVAGHVRKLLELGFAEEIVENLNPGDFLVRDGDLEPFGSAVEERMKFLSLVSSRRKVAIIGLSKTSTLCTDSGNSALFVLSRFAPAGSWLYYAGGRVGFVKLHPRSEYVFRCDILQADKQLLFSAVQLLAANSEDPSFLGYPYGLIEADKFARVSRDEAAQLGLRLAVQSRDAFKPLQHALDAHGLLNVI